MFFLVGGLVAQRDTTYFGECPDGLYRSCRLGTFAHYEKSIGVYPEILFNKNYAFSLSLSRANYRMGEGGGDGKGANIGIEIYPKNKVFAPKVSVWKSGWAFIIGGKIGLSTLLYFKKNRRAFSIRPEIGLGLIRLNITYGYNLFLPKDFEGVDRHTFTISYYHTFIPFRKRKNK